MTEDDADTVESERPEGAPADAEGPEATERESAVDDDLIERVESASAEEVTREIDALRERAADAERQVEDRREETEELESQLKRKQAEFQNYKKRTERQQEDLKARATEELVSRLLDVRDNLQRAVEQDTDTDIRPGVESTAEQFDRILDDEGVTTIEPEPGSEVDPQRHEVMLRVDSEHPEDTIAEVYRPGYEMGGKVLRAAQVTVSE